MTSVESIGSCSLNFDASDVSENLAAKYTTASEYTLQSSRAAARVNGSHELDDIASRTTLEEKSGEDPLWLTNGTSKGRKKECAVSEIKLPSYVSISCAINGYTNYSRFCRSRDNSPARSFRKSSLEANFYDSSSDHVPGHSPAPDVRCSRSHSDCNGSSKSVFTEYKHVTVSKQLQVPVQSSTHYTSKIVINGRHETGRQQSSNGHAPEEFSLAKEVGISGAKSLVQQRIESLYGVPAQEKAKFPCRTSRPTDNGTFATKRSPSCPPQVIKTQLDNKLPVFRHLTKNFRDQLLLDDAKSTAVSVKSGLKSESPVTEHSVNGIQSNGFHSLPPTIGTDECDKVHPPSPFKNSTKASPTEIDGHVYLEVMDKEKLKIQKEIRKWEEELKATEIPEEASGKIRSACGKANLLLSQKFVQFEGLCVKNIEESSDNPFYTTASDLAGFWDMVMLQVKDVQSTFEDLQALKDNSWQEKKPDVMPTKARKSSGPVSKSNPCTPKRTPKSAELAQAREEARKQLLAAKKRGRQKNTSKPHEEVSIFTPDTPS